MQRISMAAGFFALLLLGAALAPAPIERTSTSLVSRVLTTYTPQVEGAGKPNAMTSAAAAFLDRLDDERRAEAAFPLASPERANWTNVPPGSEEGGVRLGDCIEAELHAACDLLATVLSAEGYQRVRDILLADDLLLRDGQPRRGFGAENFWLAIFGTPSASKRWALQLDGHHLALNLTIEGDAIGLSPTFLGAQPARFARDGQAGRVEPLAEESALAHAFLLSLSEDQRTRAVVASERRGNQAAAGKDGFVPTPEGLPCTELKDEQRARLTDLLKRSAHILPADQAATRTKSLTAEIQAMHFAWSGPVAHPADMSYRLQGPSLILEFACQDLGGDPLQHLHCMIRNPRAEYLPKALASDR